MPVRLATCISNLILCLVICRLHALQGTNMLKSMRRAEQSVLFCHGVPVVIMN